MDSDRTTPRPASRSGADGDAAAWAARVLGGRSLLVAGPRGSGRSHLLRAIGAEVERRGGEAITVRPASALSTRPFGALDATLHPAVDAMRDSSEGDAVVDGVLIVDDIELLDAASAHAIARAVASRTLTAVLAFRTARPRDLAFADDADEARRRLRNLWVEGLAHRVDLPELNDEDAFGLLDAFPEAGVLDSATRAGLVWRADGSRALLRHLVLHAANDADAGRDPLDALRTIPPHSRLAVALERHVAEMPVADLESLAGIRRLPHLETATATRLFDADSIQSLVARGLLHADPSAERRLTANDLVAQEAQRRLGPSRIDALVAAAGRRMLAEADEWWSPSVAVTVAQRWHRLGSDLSGETAHSPAVRSRIALDAAREATRRGDAAHAAAYAARGVRAAEIPPLRSEAESGTQSDAAADGRTTDQGDDVGLRRRDPRSLPGGEGTTHRGATAPDHVLADSLVEELLAQSAREGACLDWTAAAETAGRAVAHSGATPAMRLRALVSAGTAEAFAGRWRQAQVSYRGVERTLDARQSPDGLVARDRLTALMFMLAGHQIAGADGTDVHARLEREMARTAREGEGAELTLAGAAAAIAFAGAGRAVESRRELTSAMSRTPSAVTDPDAVMIELGVADELALAGRLDEARAILARLEEQDAPLLQRSRLYVQTTLFAAEGSHDAARVAARATAEMTRGRPAAALRIRDLFRLTALGAASGDEVDELTRLAATTDLPLAAEVVRRAAARSTEENGRPVDELRLHALWSMRETPPATHPDAVVDLPRPPEPGVPPGDLTAREREIALMADEGLTNREIAARLFLSVRTVESHIYQARAKVGAASRVELGHLVASGVVRDRTRPAP
ncbi:helix-turn-helix transcriptional regulator [Microbacterium sp. VKM Ac-2923]|uniref:helix-turn-helix transcriptional regulator n=1 Tax=Microbacterium sp. VKM Ac-2923 TaxID=2929476 RepID=UPI001FB4DC36|nr:helix-turn-helix transcriptional regulator [Microbacterium sp. VKM Ac-2923]MCJ1708102.1 LuxR C-terminal-related transcriptional regulator [Microbacterium sp. VKM Ac-2923]